MKTVCWTKNNSSLSLRTMFKIPPGSSSTLPNNPNNDKRTTNSQRETVFVSLRVRLSAKIIGHNPNLYSEKLMAAIFSPEVKFRFMAVGYGKISRNLNFFSCRFARSTKFLWTIMGANNWKANIQFVINVADWMSNIIRNILDRFI